MDFLTSFLTLFVLQSDMQIGGSACRSPKGAKTQKMICNALERA